MKSKTYGHEHRIKAFPSTELLQYAYAVIACKEINATWKHSKDSFPDGKWKARLFKNESFDVYFYSNLKEIGEPTMPMMIHMFEIAFDHVVLGRSLVANFHTLSDRVDTIKETLDTLVNRINAIETHIEPLA